MIYLNLLLHEFAEGQGLREIMKLLQPQYQVPSRTTFSRSVIPQLYKTSKQQSILQINTDLLNVPAYAFAADLWTSCAQDLFISFCLSYITCEFELRVVALENKPFLGDHDSILSAETILESFEKAIDDEELLRSVLVYALKDNGSNMKLAINLSQALFDLGCFAYTFQLAINDTVKEIPGMQNMLTKSRRIVTLLSQWSSSTKAT